MRVLRRIASVSAGATLLAFSALGLTGGAASAASTLVLGTTAGVPNHSGYAYDGQPATQTLFQQPRAVTTDSNGDIFVADAQAHVVREITPDGIAHLVAGVPGIAGSDVGRSATSSHLTTPSGLLATPAGLLIADPGAHRVLLLHDGVLDAFAGNGHDASPGAAPTTDATDTPFRAPTGLAYDGAGTYYVSDSADDAVWRITSRGAVSLYAGQPGQSGSGASGSSAVGPVLDDPTALVWVSGHLVIADTGNSRIRTVSSSGKLGDLVGPGTVTTPMGLTTAGGGQVYVADAAGRVGVVAGGGISWYAGNTTHGYSPDGTLASSAGLVDPTDVAVAQNGRLLIAEDGTSSVRDIRVAAGPPHQPVAPTGTAGDGYVDVQWQAVDDGGSPITTWVVQATSAAGLTRTAQVSGSLFRLRLTGLTDGTAYTVTIAAVNTWGTSPTSGPSSALTPRAVTYTQVGTAPSTGSGSGGVLVLPTTRPSGGSGGTGLAGAGTDQGGNGGGTAPTTTYLQLSGSSGVQQSSGTPLAVAIPTPTGAPVSSGGGATVAVNPTAQPLARATAPTGPVTPSPSTVESIPLVPVRSFADAATDVAAVGKKSIVPLVLVGVLGAFLVLQGVVDRRDPKLAKAPLHADRGLEFGAA